MKHKYLIGLIILSFLTNTSLFAQEDSGKIGIILDLGGNSGGYSLNGEYEIINHEKYNVNARLGFGYLPIKGTEFFCIPFGANILTGSKSHHLEFGLGSSYINGLRFVNIQLGNSNKYYADEALYFIPSLGYRFDKLSSGLILKVYYSPLILVHDFLDVDKFINEVVPDGIVSGNTTKTDYFNYFFGDSFLPKAKSNYGFFGISIGYRFNN